MRLIIENRSRLSGSTARRAAESVLLDARSIPDYCLGTLFGAGPGRVVVSSIGIHAGRRLIVQEVEG